MLKIEKFTDVCMTGGMHYTPSHDLHALTSVLDSEVALVIQFEFHEEQAFQ